MRSRAVTWRDGGRLVRNDEIGHVGKTKGTIGFLSSLLHPPLSLNVCFKTMTLMFGALFRAHP